MKLICLMLLLCKVGMSTTVFASVKTPQFKLVQDFAIKSQQKLQNYEIGGLSGAYFDEALQKLFVTCDDRGNKGKPRILEMQVTWLDSSKVDLKALQWIEISKVPDKNVLDMEAISVLPWGTFLVASEGDLNQKPRQPPQVFEVARDGKFIRTYDVPKEFLPEPTGHQKRGVSNNFAFESLTKHPTEDRWLVASERGLLQDEDTTPNRLRVIDYRMAAAWMIRPESKTIDYTLEEPTGFIRGLSDLFWWSSDKVLALEREARFEAMQVKFKVDVFAWNLSQKKEKLIDSQNLKLSSIAETPNFETLVQIVNPSTKKKFLLMISDNNFEAKSDTVFALFESE
jgi:hypothetical protein